MSVSTKPTRGTSWAYKFGTINIVENGTRFTLLALPVSSEDERGGEMLKVAEKLLRYAKKKIKINRVYADKWFYQVRFLKAVREINADYIVQAPSNKKVKKVIGENEDKDTITINDFVIKDKYSHNA